MHIKFVEVSNFRKLKSTHIDFDKKATIFVGANNSGKTSAMVALRYFLLAPGRLALRDITIGNWTKIELFGEAWEAGTETDIDLNALLPALDVWLDVPLSEIQHVVHILPISLLTNWALRQRTARELLVALSIVLLEATAGLVGWHSQQLTAQGKLPRSAAIGEEAVVANPLKALRENVHQEAPNELLGGKGHGLALVIVAIVLPRETHPSVLDVEYAIIGDRHAVGIACDVPENLFRPVERSFGVDDPFGVPERRKVASEGSPHSQRFQGGKEVQVASVEGLIEGLQEQATEEPTEHLDR
jgi:hypothetical protein